jgi:hypothetical protein
MELDKGGYVTGGFRIIVLDTLLDGEGLQESTGWSYIDSIVSICTTTNRTNISYLVRPPFYS